ncbi:MAG: hypothetical protein ACI35R_11940 [Bacillus sp. (in: firmicutes)]
MKKIKFLLLLVLSLSLVACSSDNEAKKEEKEENGAVAVDKGLLNVEVTLPASFFEGEDLEEVAAQAKAEGIKEVTVNKDGSITYKMSKAEHKKIMKEMGTNIQQTMEEMETGKDYASIKSIKANSSYDEFTIVVNKADYENSFDGIALFGLAMQSMMYQLFDGADPDDYKVTIRLEDEETSKIFDTIVYPDALEENSETE